MSLKGKTVVFTGKCSQSRTAMQKEAAQHGLIVGKSITKKTDYLVSGDQIAANATGAKYKKAKANDVIILLEEEYRQLLSGKSATKKKAPKTSSSKSLVSFDRWVYDLGKTDLTGFLRSLNDTTHSYDWNRMQLIEQLKTYSLEQIIKNLPPEQSKQVLFSLRLEFDSEESAAQQRKRIAEKFSK